MSLTYISRSYSNYETTFTYELENDDVDREVALLLAIPVCTSTGIYLSSTTPTSASGETEPESGLVGSLWDTIGK